MKTTMEQVKEILSQLSDKKNKILELQKEEHILYGALINALDGLIVDQMRSS